MKRRENLLRFTAVGVLFCAICLVYVGRLIYLQVAGQDYYTMARPTTYITRTVPIQACRGEIFDVNGTPLVTNLYTYDLQLDYGSFPKDNDSRNQLLTGLLLAGDKHGSVAVDCGAMPFTVSVTGSGALSLSLRESFFAGALRCRRFVALIDGLNVDTELAMAKPASTLLVSTGSIPYTDGDEDTTDAIKQNLQDFPPIERCVQALLERYGLIAYIDKTDTTGYLLYSPEETVILLMRRLDMELADFSAAAPYTMFTDIPLTMVSHVEESFDRGIRISIESTREYHYPGFASHILGRVNKIPKGQETYYTEQGYALDAIVGISGVEQAFEQYLRGVDGVLTITEDTYGNIVQTEVTKAPVAGNDVYLTIDIGLQMAAEIALAENIQQIREEADPNNPLSGEDASVGALVTVDVDTGAVLAIASYPTYNLATFNRDYTLLSTDKNSPMFNRALQGTYAPGSTYKVGVAVAALEEGIIEADTIIDAQGKYTYYEGFQPECWVYAYKGVHGKINVTEAIQDSCNYFFFEVGRLLTIDTMNERMKKFGLGMPTGIELYEETGVLASPDYRNDNGLDKWSPGDTIQAAIGQSDNLFTPLQLTMYYTTLLNQGVRYSAHILDRVLDYEGNTVYTSVPTVLEDAKFSDETLEVIREGMKNVMDNGSAARVFAGYPISVGGKTGTAQVYKNKSDNAVMTAFAPYENPKIAVTCIIEQGYSGTKAGYAIKDVFDYYFELE